MPAFNLTSETRALARYDVVGEHSESASGFVKHVALYNAELRDVNYNDCVDVVHMGPPLETDGRVNVHVSANIPLTSAEVAQIAAWIAKIRDEYIQSGAQDSRRQYIIHPPWKDVHDSNTGVRRYRRYSCAGFVLDSHRQIDVELLDVEEQSLPEVSLATLALAYPGVNFQSHHFGMQGDGPWRIVLAGYVLHALDRPTEQIREDRYQAKPGDERF